ncbi:ABC transporter ATP-binding protein [Martelella endophytica]|uniref:Spermidine/putrescine ABC transporter ATP-binding protein n=1 Tax=Martelella endophytica TaxID=1486262 RepID=A0A0D5LSW3_MAREN|nr:ABC transporter ATP-binding protein [Martelella endophytica]AJY47299.1 spermidine/putrescine ABC transporter ATP-binding protein [Martelella endophytica]
MANLTVRQVNKSYSGRPVLKNIDAELKSGELVTLLGPSGCGKTTLLRIIAGLENTDSGEILLDGTDIAGLAANRRNMGMVFQAYSLFPNMTAAENVGFGLTVRGQGSTRIKARVGELLDLVGLTDFAHSYPHQMSGGMQQRVALARALAIEPSLLLLDEPLSALDAKVRVQLREEIHRIQKETGITTIFVTHDQEEALSISDRVAVMYQGRIDQFAAPADIYYNPATRFVLEFIGTSTRLDGKVIDGQSGVIDLGGHRFAHEEARGLGSGEAVSVYVRPEAFALAEPDGASALLGKVSDRTFMGANTRVEVTLGDRRRLVADMPSTDARHLPDGAEIALSFRPDHAHLVKGDPASGQ